MRELILQKLEEIERTENITVLHAVESGSRAWGFPSPDSDFDVRFLYVRKKEDYLKLEKTRDVIELPINDLLDINGWDLNKTLQLLHGSNPTLYEWMSSPIVYRRTDFPELSKPVFDRYFSPRKTLHHYLSTANANYRDHLKRDMVRAKKYFYVLRPLLACQWVLENRTNPPMLFSELMERYLDESLKPVVTRLLDLKMNSPEIKEIPRIDELNRYLDERIAAMPGIIASLPEEKPLDWEPLNRLFLDILDRNE